MKTLKSLDIQTLQSLYKEKALTPKELIAEILEEAKKWDSHNIWIHQMIMEEIEPYLNALPAQATLDTPLWGIPFAIKDNIDLAGIPTTAACPEYSYIPEEHATCVQLLIDAGAIPIGKTNLDQFATGLVGTRSPYGVCKNAINEKYISGGSSSGSAVAVAAGLASFSLGTDTAGSGRVPAALNNLIGLKPSRGLISNTGMVPACKTLDCIAVFTENANDASLVFDVVNQYDPKDAYSCEDQEKDFILSSLRMGIPKADQLEFFGNTESQQLFEEAKEKLIQLGHEIVEIDFQAFLDAAKLLYHGPWVAERYAAIEDLMKNKPESLHPVTHGIIKGAENYTAVDAFKSEYALKDLRRVSEAVWEDIDVLVTPTIGTIYSIEDLEKEPVQYNTNLGYYTNFMNLLDLCAVAFPAGKYSNEMPYGITVSATKFSDTQLLSLAGDYEEIEGDFEIGVCGAHMSELPLNYQLTDLGGKFVKKTKSSPNYKLYNLKNLDPIRPGMLRQNEGGVQIELEIWSLPKNKVGNFLELIKSPLGIGTIELEDNTTVQGFTCENWATKDADDISEYGSWRKFLES